MEKITSQKILLVFPHNFFDLNSGVNRRFFELVKYLHAKNCSIDVLGLKHFDSNWNSGSYNTPEPIVRTLFLYDFRIGYHLNLLLQILKRPFSIIRSLKGQAKHLPDFAFPGMKRKFMQIVRSESYDRIVIGYVYFANLLKWELPGQVDKVLMMEDLLSFHPEIDGLSLDSRTAFAMEEISRLSLFNKIVCISYDELTYCASRNSLPNYFHVPVFLSQKKDILFNFEFDILFVGFANRENLEALNWFLYHVKPILSPAIKILIVGSVSDEVPEMLGVYRIRYSRDLDTVYSRCRIAINPMQGGTGMKVKLVEALSYGIPIVSTPQGLCGLTPEIRQFMVSEGSPAGFACEINRLLKEPEYYETNCQNSKYIFNHYFDIESLNKTLDRIFL